MERRDFFKIFGLVSVPVLLKPSLLLPAEKSLIIPPPVAPVITPPKKSKANLHKNIGNLLADLYSNMECDDLYVDKVYMSGTNFDRALKFTESFVFGFKNDSELWGAQLYKSDLSNESFILESTCNGYRFSYSMVGRLLEDNLTVSQVINKSIFGVHEDKRMASFRKIIERPAQHTWSALDVKDIQKDCKKIKLHVGRCDTLDSHRIIVANEKEELDEYFFGMIC